MKQKKQPRTEQSLAVTVKTLEEENDELKGTIRSLYRHYCDMADIARKFNNNLTEYIQLKEREMAILKDRRFLESQMQGKEHSVRIGSNTCMSNSIEKAILSKSNNNDNDDNLPF